MTKTKKIAVFRALQIGDMLCSVPAFRALRAYYPDAEITLLGLPWAKEFVQRFSRYIDNFIPFPGYPGLPEQPFESNKILKFITRMHDNSFDLLLQMHGDGSITNQLIKLLGAKKKGGFYKINNGNHDEKTFLEYPHHLSEIEKNLALLEFLGIPSHGTYLEFPIFENETKNVLNHPLFQKIRQQPYICIHPGARDPQRRWSPLYFAYIADTLAENFVVVFTGTKEELPIIAEITSSMKHNPLIFAGQLTIGATAQLLKYATLLISNCTSVVHIADALGTPTVTLYLASNPQQWAPLDTRIHQQILKKESKNPRRVLEKVYDLLFYCYKANHATKGAFL